jgi:hypothetical protein
MSTPLGSLSGSRFCKGGTKGMGLDEIREGGRAYGLRVVP